VSGPHSRGPHLPEFFNTPFSVCSIEMTPLSPRERDVLALVAEGKTNGEVGAALGLSPRTVGKHLEHVFEKFGVHTRTAAAAEWFRRRSP